MTNLIRTETQAKATFGYVSNANHTPDASVKHIYHQYLTSMLEGMDIIINIYKTYTPLKNISPMFSEMIATRNELKIYRDSL